MEVDTQAAAAPGDELRRLLAATVSPDKAAVDAATAGDPRFPIALLAITAGDGDQGIRIAAATYLKNFTRRNTEGGLSPSDLYKEFRDQLAQALLGVEPAILRVLIEVYFLNPKVVKEPVPEQLEQIATEILVPLQVTFHHFADKVLLSDDGIKLEYAQLLLITCKCMYFTKLNSLSDRNFSLAFDVISRVLETGPGWRLVLPHFSSLLDSAIFPALALNEKWD